MAALPKLYYDLMSQPCRALYMFLRLNKVPYEDRVIDMMSGEHMTEEYEDVHPFHLAPAFEDNGFKLTESLAIVEYLMLTRNLPERWLPRSDVRKRVKVYEYLHWQHVNTRGNCAYLFQQLLLIPRRKNKPVDWQKVKDGRKRVQQVMKNLEKYFLKDTPFLSSDVMTVADIFGACELMQLNGVCEEGLYESSPIVKAWMERVKDQTNPLFDEAHQKIYKVREVYQQTAKL